MDNEPTASKCIIGSVHSKSNKICAVDEIFTMVFISKKILCLHASCEIRSYSSSSILWCIQKHITFFWWNISDWKFRACNEFAYIWAFYNLKLKPILRSELIVHFGSFCLINSKCKARLFLLFCIRIPLHGAFFHKNSSGSKPFVRLFE